MTLSTVFLIVWALEEILVASAGPLEKPQVLPISVNELRNEEFSGMVPLGNDFSPSQTKIEVIKNSPFFVFSTKRTILIVNPETNKHYVLNREIKTIRAYSLIQGTNNIILAGTFVDDSTNSSAVKVYDWRKRRPVSKLWAYGEGDNLLDIYDFAGASLSALHFGNRILFFSNVSQAGSREPLFKIEGHYNKCKYFEGTIYFICLKGQNFESSLVVFSFIDGKQKYFFELRAVIKDFIYVKKADRIIVVARNDTLLLLDYRKTDLAEAIKDKNAEYSNKNVTLLKEIPSEDSFITVGAHSREIVVWSLSNDKIEKQVHKRFEKFIYNLEPVYSSKGLYFVLLSDHALKYVTRDLKDFGETLPKVSDLHPLQNLFSSPSRIFSLLKVNQSYFLLKKSDSTQYYNKTLNTPYLKVVSVLENDGPASTEYLLYLEPDNQTFFFYIVTNDFVISEKGVKLPNLVTNFEVSDNHLIIFDNRNDIYSLNWRNFFLEDANPMRHIKYDKAAFGKPLLIKSFSVNSKDFDYVIVFQKTIRLYDSKNQNSTEISSSTLDNPSFVFTGNNGKTFYLLNKTHLKKIKAYGAEFKEELSTISFKFNDVGFYNESLYFATNEGIYEGLQSDKNKAYKKLNIVPSTKLFVKNHSYIISHSEGVQIFDFSAPCPDGYILYADKEFCRKKCEQGHEFLFDDFEICSNDCSLIPFYQPDFASNADSSQTSRLCKPTCLEENCEQCLNTGGCMKCKPNYLLTKQADSNITKCTSCDIENDAILLNGMGECFLNEVAKKQIEVTPTAASPWLIGGITLGVAAFIIVCVFLIIYCRRRKSQTSYENFD